MGYEVKIDTFEGPIDLLLHLLNKNEVQIYDIKISEITDQYLDYIATMQKLDLDVASEFLIMAARLIEVKAETLLPSKQGQDQDKDKKDNKDPRQKLVERLLEYKKYKDLATKLQAFEAEERKSYTRNVAPLLSQLEFEEENPLEDIGVDDFAAAFKKVLIRHKLKQEDKTEDKQEGISHLTPQEVTIKEQQGYIMQQLVATKGLNFTDLFVDLETKLEIVVTFMAVLELIKMKEVKVEQIDNFARIKIYHVRSGS
ncbi:hypothetical protein Halha_0609 [Halobacteroides halobius DSM 5150]|uniref:Segregation and condensation protein A n=1 Tax=Halobacteroides halobius (strain ATCC 35273 / DSM 5150 / MD-1) TaxID=748449 RepID=L0K5L6_HALHC|nr:segregation/condensation protein A [Halobacteroides halobius]AGB40582.1 hypothetical protein Halha_0609 [Halobacteroides halobius DSM 5150]